jgi:alcohol dehydrogenase (NADP+)
MKTKLLNNEKSIPSLGLGTWLSDAGEVYKIVKSAVRNGYRHIDCAAVYGNEKEIGQAFEELFNEGVVKREDLFITSKLWNNAHAREDVVPALKQTLNDLKLDYLDLYLIHWPVAFKKGVGFPSSVDEYISLEELPVIETYSEMENAVDAGLVKSIGVSNFSKKKLEDLISKARIKPVMNQVELHPYLQQNDLLNFCNENNVALTGYSPLGSSGRPAEMLAANEPSLLENEVIGDISKKHGVSPAQVILNWANTRGTVVIPKTVTPHRAIENLESEKVELDSSDMDKIASLDKHFRYVNGAFFTPDGGHYTLANLWDE